MMVVSSFSQYCCFKKRRRDKREIYDRDTGEETTSKRGPTELWIYKISFKRKKKKKIHRLYEMLAALERASTSSWVYECVPFSSFLSLSLPDLPTRYITIGRSSSSSIKFHAEEHLKVSFFVLLF